MPNPFFQFKQFVVQQDQCAMKVSTDSCLFGAWLSKKIIPSLPDISQVLDIGSGTGLLMLMMAQEHAFHIDGIELDEAAYRQALSNIESTPWKDRLQLFHGNVNMFEFSRSYDLVISNPPFYEHDLLPNSKEKASAMHATTLTFEDLLKAVDENLSPGGFCAFLIPYRRLDHFAHLAISKGFYLHNVVHVRHQTDHDMIRSMILFGRNQAETKTEILTIKEADGSYTSSFVHLLQAYYLYL
jgi:tRNA1Val (adenine37-N6)-methyltransferase